MATLQGHGLSVDLPAGWDGRITRRPVDPMPPEVRPFAAASGRDMTESTHTVAHLANFPLPEQRGDFGSGAVEIMRPGDVLVVLLEYDPDSTKTALFATKGMPRQLDPSAFSAYGLQHALPGQGGAQWFFQEAGRAWCLYVVLGDLAGRSTLVATVERMLAAIRIDPQATRWSA
ncbi:MAG: hypothetical protein JWO37_3049 [Acidimicrobiales bacterium]|jgi:hypothetical protein|nr:hypothetical protein [Acidimicrobiales bacterium]